MARFLEVEGQIELKCHADKFFAAWVCKPLQIPNMCANKITKLELQDGEGHTVGAVKNWTYCFKENGVAENTFSLTTKVEELDVEKRVITYSCHDGFIMKNYYKTLKSKMQVTPKSETNEGCIVKWSFEYEKMNEDVHEPNVYIDFLLELAKDVDAYCLSNND
ncbi:MLP-like protein 43 [Bienertia sinuspersici]